MSVNPVKRALEQALQGAFRQCDSAGLPLNEAQRQIVQQVTLTLLLQALVDPIALEEENPLASLSEEQRSLLLDYVAQCDRQGQDWKTVLFNDWVEGRSSGAVQFLRDRYGFDWIQRLQPVHLGMYREDETAALGVGDRIEVSSRLWEWIPEELGEEPEWMSCTVIHLDEVQDADKTYCNGVVRFESGLELEIMGLNDWNRSNWRRPKSAL